MDGVAAFSGAYNLLGGSGGVLDAGLLFVTYAYQVAFPGGAGDLIYHLPLPCVSWWQFHGFNQLVLYSFSQTETFQECNTIIERICLGFCSYFLPIHFCGWFFLPLKQTGRFTTLPNYCPNPWILLRIDCFFQENLLIFTKFSSVPFFLPVVRPYLPPS